MTRYPARWSSLNFAFWSRKIISNRYRLTLARNVKVRFAPIPIIRGSHELLQGSRSREILIFSVGGEDSDWASLGQTKSSMDKQLWNGSSLHQEKLPAKKAVNGDDICKVENEIFDNCCKYQYCYNHLVCQRFRSGHDFVVVEKREFLPSSTFWSHIHKGAWITRNPQLQTLVCRNEC